MNVPAAIAALADAGVDRAVLVAELGVHRTTVARWAAGATRPNGRNMAALRALVDELHHSVLAGSLLSDLRQDAALRAAREHLLTDAERADIEALTARLVADMEAYAQRPAESSDPFAHCTWEAA